MDDYIRWYNSHRIRLLPDSVSPENCREMLDFNPGNRPQHH
ncbi:IS3 family transposase [Pantoea stewartii]